MSPPDFARVKQALAEAMERRGMERVRWMAQLAEDDPELHAEVSSLLAHDDDPSITDVVGDLGEHLARALTVDTPEHIGPYKILGVLGQGGMGVVYRGLQTDPLRREVAIKVLRSGPVSEIGAARFRTEARALARLDHPHIAAVYDAGLAQNRPYLALQLVDGQSLIEACADRPLDDRLAVFRDICDAIAHAHRRGVVHRDLKPSNLLVTHQNGRLWPMVIDFGIARDERRDEGTLTSAGQFVGTPAYMSPEQAGAFGGVVDTRTDVYALGVVLFELVSGRRLHPSDAHSLEAIRKRLTTGTVPRPSAVAPVLGTVPARQLKGDLDTIVAMALRPEPDRRYGSVDAMAEDIRRHVDGRPVLARGDSAPYLVGRFVRRHRGLVALGAMLGLGLIGAATVGVVQDVRIRAQRDRAIAAEKAAQDEAAGARQVADFLVDMFAQANPSNTGGDEVTAQDLLEQGAGRIDEELGDRPLLHATLLLALGRSYHGLGEYERARELVARSLALRDEHLDRDHPDRIASLALMGAILHDQGAYQASIEVATEALELARGRSDAADVSHVANGLAITLDAVGQHEKAETLYREALELYRTAHGEDDPEVAWLMNTWAQAHYRLGRVRQAHQILVEAEALARRTLGRDHIERAYILHNLGVSRSVLGDQPGSEAELRECLRIFTLVVGPDHPGTHRGQYMLARALLDRDRPEEALPLADRAIEGLLASVGDHRLTGNAYVTRARVRIAAADLDGADADLRAVEEMIARADEPDAWRSTGARAARVTWHEARGDHQRALALVQTIIDDTRRRLGDDHYTVAQLGLRRATLLDRLGDCAGAMAQIDEALPTLDRELGQGHPKVEEARRLRQTCEG